jgi:hypothetical protein
MQRVVRGLALVKRRQARGSLVAFMMLSKQALAVRHCTALQNGQAVFGSLFARKALGIAGRAFLQGWRRPAGGAETGIVPMLPLLCLPSPRFGRVVRPCRNGPASEHSPGAMLPAHAILPNRWVPAPRASRHRGRLASVPHLARAIQTAALGTGAARRAIGTPRLARAAVTPRRRVAPAPAQLIAPKPLANCRAVQPGERSNHVVDAQRLQWPHVGAGHEVASPIVLLGASCSLPKSPANRTGQSPVPETRANTRAALKT